MNATFWPLKTMPSSTASAPNDDRRRAGDADLLVVRRMAAADHVHEDVVGSALAPASVRPATTARIVANATAAMKPRNAVPPSSSAASGAAMLPPASTAAMSSRPTSADAPNPTIGMIR